MAKAKFPLVISRGSASVTLYHTPVKRPRRYDAYTLAYTFGGRRVRKKFHDLDAAKTAAETTAIAIANGDLGRRQLTETETAEYLAACAVLGDFRLKLIDAVHEFAEAKRDLPEVHLVQAVQFFKRYAGDKLARIEVADAVSRFLAHKLDQGVGGYHQHDLKTRLQKFAARFAGDLAQVSTTDINAWLKALQLEPRTQNNYRAAVVQLFNFAKTDLKAVPHWLPHAAEESIRVLEPAKDTEIYSPEEMQLILDKAPARLGFLIAVRAFSGIRNEELAEVHWDEFDFKRDVIKLKRAVTKTAQRRVMPMHANLKEWLLGVSPREGRLADGYGNAKTMSEAISTAIADAGVTPRRNALRNSYTSYRLAILGEVGKVAEETGNSPGVIKREYLELTTPDVAAKWFAICPENRGPVPTPRG